MAEFAYNNAKNTNMSYTPFELKSRYHPYVFYKMNVNSRSKSKSANKLTKKLENLIAVYRKNLQHAQKLQKRAYNKEIKPRNYVCNKKVLLNSKYIKIKYNRKLDTKFFEFF